MSAVDVAVAVVVVVGDAVALESFYIVRVS